MKERATAKKVQRKASDTEEHHGARFVLTSVSKCAIILSAPRIKPEHTVIPCHSRKSIRSIRRKFLVQLLARTMIRKRNFAYNVLYAVLLLETVQSYFANAKPLSEEDVIDLLPPTPQTTNETLAAIVQDPVVQNAVQDAIGNGSLSGLVVRKKVSIMSASQPDKVLSQSEQVLVVPATHLEDVRKNITESNATDDFGLLEEQFVTKKANEVVSEENDLVYTPDEMFGEPQSNTQKPQDPALTDISVKTEIELPESSQKLKISEDVTVPIVAIVNPSKIDSGKIDSPIVAVIPPSDVSSSHLRNQINILRDNREKLTNDVQRYVDQMSLTTQSGNWDTSKQDETYQRNQLLQLPEETVFAPTVENAVSEEIFLTPKIVSPFEVLWPANQNVGYQGEDMDVAEDIVFRPLFRYRQEAEQKSRYRNSESYFRRPGFRRYGPYTYDSYRRRYNSGYSGEYY